MYFFTLCICLLLNDVCGTVHVKTDTYGSLANLPSLVRRKRLMGGIETQPKEVMMVGSLQRKVDRKHFCGVTLITFRHGITGCSCARIGLPTTAGLLEMTKYVVVAGDKRWDTQDERLIRDVISFRMDSRCEVDETTGMWKFSLGYIQWSVPFLASDEVAYAPGMAHTQNQFDATFKDFTDNPEYAQGSKSKFCYTYGWGAQKYDRKTGNASLFPFYLNKRAVQFITLKECQTRLCSNGFCSFKIDQAGAVCLGVPDDDDGVICKGDAGGPLVCGNKLYGVAEEMPDCGLSLKFAAFYKLNIQQLYNFIKSASPVSYLFSHKTRAQWFIPIFFLYLL